VTGPEPTGAAAVGPTGTGTAQVRALTPLVRAARAPTVIALIVLAAAVLIGLLSASGAPGLLDPAAAEEDGSRAIAALVRQQGVTVDVVRTADQARVPAGTTLLVPFPDRLAPAQLAAVAAAGADVVLVAPGPEVLAALTPGVEQTARTEAVETREPGCALPAAVRAGAVTVGGAGYRVEGGAEGAAACYPTDNGAALVQVVAGGRTVTALGSPDVLQNRSLADEGNASLAIGLLATHPRLAWFLPEPEGPPVGTEESLLDLVPPGWLWGAGQLAVAVVLLALWRGRRLGPVVAEPLPVVVRSAETDEGRARLYRAAGAREHAAEVLRTASRARLAPLLGLSVPAERAALVAAVGERIGRSGQVQDVLYGPAPADDAALVALADRLDELEREVRAQ
jgi:hypothetical protein